MIIVLGILAAAALGGVIYLFLSPKSTKIQKFAALGALIVCGIAILISGFRIFLGSGEANDPYAFPLAAETAQPRSSDNFAELIIFLVVLLLVFGLIIRKGIMDSKKIAPEKPGFKRTAANKTTSKEKEKIVIDDDADFIFEDF